MNSKGFTLIELIVVMFIAGMIVAGVLLNTSLIDPNKKFITLTEKIGKLLHHAHQQAELNNENYALSLTKDGYVFLIYQGDGWAPMKKKPLQRGVFAKNIKQDLSIDNKLVEVLKKDEYTPHILLLASGEMSPFEWTITDRDNDLEIVISGTYNGSISIEKNEL